MTNKKYLSNKQTLIPGIYGGMGPMAHIYFEELLLEASKNNGNEIDQEHPVWITISGSSTPDRTQSLNGKASALKHLVHFCNNLEIAGADFIVMTCNTAHAYKMDIEKHTSIPILSMIDITANHIKNNFPANTKVGILATSGTLKTKLYQRSLFDRGLEYLSPKISSTTQDAVMDAIYNKRYGIKSTGTYISKQAKEKIYKAADKLISSGAQIILAGCTELSFCLSDEYYRGVPVIDPLKVTSQKVISLAFKNVDTHQPEFSSLHL